MKIIKYLFLALPIFLVACTNDQGATLSCPGPTATGCDSLSTVFAKTTNSQTQKKVTAIKLTPTPIENDNPPELIPAQLLRVWVAPWEDQAGDLHDDQYIYLVIKPARWLINKHTVPIFITEDNK